jgi:hypothetical protein
MVYFAYGALGIIDVTRDMWIKESLTLSPAELAEISVWFGLPWTVKMVFGELVDTIAPDWILPGRGTTPFGMGTSARWLHFGDPSC